MIKNTEKQLKSDKKRLDKTVDKLIESNINMFDDVYGHLTKIFLKGFKASEDYKIPSKINEIDWNDYQYILTKILQYSEYVGRLSAKKDVKIKNADPLIEFSFSMPFNEALEYFTSLEIVSAEQFYADLQSYSGISFTVSRITQLDTIAAIQEAIIDAMSSDAFDPDLLMETIQQVAVSRGETALNPFHLETIIQTNVQTAYSKGRYLQLTGSKMPYWQYFAIDDKDTTPLCKDLDGRVFRADDPFWDTYYPPNHFNCRSSVMGVDDLTAEMEGLNIEPHGVHTPHGVGEGFNTTPDVGLENYLEERCDELGIPMPQDRNPIDRITEELG